MIRTFLLPTFAIYALCSDDYSELDKTEQNCLTEFLSNINMDNHHWELQYPDYNVDLDNSDLLGYYKLTNCAYVHLVPNNENYEF